MGEWGLHRISNAAACTTQISAGADRRVGLRVSEPFGRVKVGRVAAGRPFLPVGRTGREHG